MLQLGDKIVIIWNTEGLPQDEANGHYPNEAEVITINRIDEGFYYDNKLAVEVPINQTFLKLSATYIGEDIKADYYINKKDLDLL